jgi:hypothetical protein
MNPHALVEAITAIDNAQAKYPNLSWDGFYPVYIWGGQREQPQTNTPRLPEQVAMSIDFLRHCLKTTPGRGLHAYALKHMVEDWVDLTITENTTEGYVPMGAVIMAAIHLGFPIKIQKRETLSGFHPKLPMNDAVWIGVDKHRAAELVAEERTWYV